MSILYIFRFPRIRKTIIKGENNSMVLLLISRDNIKPTNLSQTKLHFSNDFIVDVT